MFDAKKSYEDSAQFGNLLAEIINVREAVEKLRKSQYCRKKKPINVRVYERDVDRFKVKKEDVDIQQEVIDFSMKSLRERAVKEGKLFCVEMAYEDHKPTSLTISLMEDDDGN